MDLHQLRIFATIAEEGNLTRASERLYSSQPAISAQLKALEEELGLELFQRMPKGMRLTAHGKRLLDQAQRILADSDRLLSRAREIRGDVLGLLRIGLNTDADYLRVSPLYRLLKQRHPGIELQFIPGMSVEHLASLRISKLDAAFVSGETDDPQLSLMELDRTRLHVAAPGAWAERLKSAGIADLAREPWVQTSPNCIHFQLVRELFEQQGCPPPASLIADQEDALVSLVKSGAGLGILREDEIRRHQENGDLQALPVELPPLPLSLAVLKKNRDQPALRALREALTDIWSLAENCAIGADSVS